MRSLSILATAALACLSTVHALFLVPRQVALPTCSQVCLMPGTVSFGSCSENDNECLCKSPTYVQGVLNCITASCTSQTDIDTTIKYADALCQALSITTAPAGVTTAAPGEPKTTAAATATTTSAAAPSKTGAASAPIGVNQPLVLFGAAAVAFGVAL